MFDTTDLLRALRDVGVAGPATGDSGDASVRRALERELDRPRRRRRRVRLPFGSRSIALLPATLLVTAATAAAAGGAIALFDAGPLTLFEKSPNGFSGTGLPPHQTVVASTVRMIDAFHVPGVGAIQYWVADTAQHGLCQALRRPGGTWAGYPDHGTGGGEMPGCGATRAQVVASQGDRPVGLLPMSVDEQWASIRGTAGGWWDIYYGIVSARGAAGVKDPASGQTAPLIDGRYFVLVVREPGSCAACDNLRAIDAAGRILPADYGPEPDRNH